MTNLTNLTYLDDFASFEDMMAARANKPVDDVWSRHEAFMKSDIQVAYSNAFDEGLKKGLKVRECTKLAQDAANSI